jgi:hypothetical protein
MCRSLRLNNDEYQSGQGEQMTKLTLTGKAGICKGISLEHLHVFNIGRMMGIRMGEVKWLG